MEVIMILVGFIIYLAFMAVVVAVVLPIMATYGRFVNQPTGQPSGIHFFTRLSPGEVKIIVRGKKPVRMIMNTAGKRFHRIRDKNYPEYWKIVDGPTEDPTSDIHPLIRPWAKVVYHATGLVFTGVYPIQRVYEYELERTSIRRDEAGGKSNIVLAVKTDVSDHFRTRQFLFGMHVTKAESNDKIPLDIIGVAEMWVENPHLAAYGTDRWDHSVVNLVTDTITAETKQMTLDQILTAGSEDEARRINTAVERITDDQLLCGIQVDSFRILEINPALNGDELAKIQAEALALQVAKATRIDGKARADVLREMNKAHTEGGEYSIASMEAETFVRAAEAAGKSGGTVILQPQGGSKADPTHVAILAELQKLRGDTAPRRNK